jgi:hypothetical protein
MSGFPPFAPKAAGTLAITTGTGSVAIPLIKPASATVIRVKNADATNTVFINFGTSTVTAAIPTPSASAPAGNSLPIVPGEVALFNVAEGTTHIAVISSAATPLLYVTPGN